MRNYYGLNFPFLESVKGNYVKMTQTVQEEIRSNLIHLILTRKGTRYFLPDFGTRLYEFIFEQMDPQSFSVIEEDIRNSCSKFLPNLTIESIIILTGDEIELTEIQNTDQSLDGRIFRSVSETTKPYTAQIKINYSINNNGVFSNRDFVVINI